MERNLAYVALFTALTAVLTLMPAIAMPFGVPITLQTFGVMLAGVVLGPWLGALSLLLYILLGLIGLPIFSGGNGGLGALMGPTAGFLISYPIAAFIIGAVMHSLKAPVGISAFLASVLGGIVVVYAFGVPGLALNTGMALDKAVTAMAVFIPGDLIKAILAAVVAQGLAKARPGVLLSRH